MNAGGLRRASILPEAHNQIATHRCVVCQKPILPQVHGAFGYLCSPFCKNQGRGAKIDCTGLRGSKDRRRGKNTGKKSVKFPPRPVSFRALFGFWFWYAWFGSVPPSGICRALRRSGLHRRGEILREGPKSSSSMAPPGRAMTSRQKENLVAGVVHPAAGCRRNQPAWRKFIGDLGRPVDPPKRNGWRKRNWGWLSTAGCRIERWLPRRRN